MFNSISDADVDRKVMSLGLHHMPVAALPPEDIAQAAVFLASGKARSVSAGSLDV